MEPELIQVSVAGPAVLASVAAGLESKNPDTPADSSSSDPKTNLLTKETEVLDKKQN
ncbi:MAG: hypothetical protein RLZZ108_689 [Actinomycetota bacterium]